MVQHFHQQSQGWEELNVELSLEPRQETVVS